MTVLDSHQAEARAALDAGRGLFLLPYRRQLIVVDADFIVEIGLDPADPAWAVLQRDLAAGYASEAWATLAFQRIKAPRSTFASG